jgi:nucleoside-diphosphate-sugar epimerase
MRVFEAGATGAIGQQLVPRLVAAGHESHGMTWSDSKRALLSQLGAVPVVADTTNAKAKHELGWRPAHPSWREGLAAA